MEGHTKGGSRKINNGVGVGSGSSALEARDSRNHSPTYMNKRRSWVRAILVFVISLVVIDVSSARIRYHYRLLNELTPLKQVIETSLYEYHGSVPSELQDCHAYDRESGVYIHNCTLSACEQNALLLSEKRQQILLDVRSRHPFAEGISAVYDRIRGVDQLDKITSLFARKPCERIISSSDKTNFIVDVVSLICILLGLYMTSVSIRMIVTR